MLCHSLLSFIHNATENFTEKAERPLSANKKLNLRVITTAHSYLILVKTILNTSWIWYLIYRKSFAVGSSLRPHRRWTFSNANKHSGKDATSWITQGLFISFCHILIILHEMASLLAIKRNVRIITISLKIL